MPPLYDFKTHLLEKFGCKVHRISIDAGFTCPNRDGTKGLGGCIYCGEKGSGTGQAASGISISEQITIGKKLIFSRYKAKKGLAYFQAFSNTHGPVEALKRCYNEALSDPDIVGLCIATRPDCVDEQKLDLIASCSEKYLVWIEYGLQSIHDKTLKLINRQHTADDFVKAVRLTQERNILICAHVILGLPGETRKDIRETAQAIACLNIDGIKLHSLYVSADTPLAKLYQRGEYVCLSQKEYIELAVDFISILPPSIIIHRMTGDPDRHRLIAPLWALNKQDTIRKIRALL
ncbi:MAG: TIGR01212 family radical SAM protein [Pseudomonadota bacterium]